MTPADPASPLPSEPALVGAALALGARDVAGWSPAETAALARLDPVVPGAAAVAALRRAIAEGADPLGEALQTLRSPEERRPQGATYTPPEIVGAMIDWAAAEGRPARVIDPGSGSGRFAVAAARRFPDAQVVAVELDPLAAVIGRGHLAAAGLAERARVVLGDYRSFRPKPVKGRTLYLGNPPYVRHHQIAPRWKDWLLLTARAHALSASGLAGLHVHFFLATAVSATAGDYGAFITSAEWLDVNYGRLVRELMLEQLGGEAIHVLEPTARPFEDAATTGAIACFRIASRPRSIRLRRIQSVAQLDALRGGQPVLRQRLVEADRWSPLTRPARGIPEGYVELGEICRVHRGAVTGSNATFVVGPDIELPPEVLFPSITRARELFEAGEVLGSLAHLRRVVDIPPNIELFEGLERRLIDRFLKVAKKAGVPRGYIARNRRAWWSVGLRPPAPILATYMARRPPVFVHNRAEARHINIAHGLYPRQELPARALERLAAALRTTVSMADGRTYAGGLTKFEPREMERLPVPGLEILLA